jgi:hypothetical protein
MKSTTTSLALLAAVTAALAVTACGNGSSTPAAPQNVAPTVSAIPAQSIDQDTPTPALAFSVNDESGPGTVTLTASTSNAAVIPIEGITLGGSGSARTITLTPSEDATGVANIAVTATDPTGLQSTAHFDVTVRAVEKSIANYTTMTFAESETDTPAQVSGFTFVQDADEDTTFDSLLQ